MGKSKPAAQAMARNVEFKISRAGRPWETLLIPKTVPNPNCSFTCRNATRVSITWICSALAVLTKQSMNISSSRKPYSWACRYIFLATCNRPTACSGIPFSSKHKPKTAAPYFLASGKTTSKCLSSPVVELISGRPTKFFNPSSTASGLVESIDKGISMAD